MRPFVKSAAMVALLCGAASLAMAAPPERQQPPQPQDPPRILKKRVAVMPIADRIVAGGRRQFVESVAAGMTEMLSASLAETGRFVVVERAAMNTILSEQELGRAGITTQQTAARSGQVLGAQVLINGAITEFELTSRDRALGVGVGDFRVNLGRARSTIGLDVRAYDPNTSQVVTHQNARGNASATRTQFAVIGNRIDVTAADFQRSALGRAMREAVEEIVADLVAAIGSDPWQGRLIVHGEDSLFVNAGDNQSLRVGDRFAIVRPGQEIVDPETGLVLARAMNEVGVIEVTQVNEGHSVARAIYGRDFVTGDVVQEIVGNTRR